MRNYVSLLMDIEKSRKYEIDERIEIQNHMSYNVELLNDLFKDNMELSVTFSGGDELQGLFKDTTSAILYFRIFELLMKPVNIRAGIGIGAWTVKIKDGLSTQQDGPAYHKARKAIEDVYKSQLQNIRICSEADDTMANHLINASMPLKRQQIYKQNIVLFLIELLYPFVTKRMKLDNYNTIKELITAKFQYRLGTSLCSSEERDISSKKLRFCADDVPNLNPIIIDGELLELEDLIIKKNTATTISEILGSTRQNISSIIKRGNAYKIRELDFMALQYLEKTYRGGNIWGL